MAKKTTKKVAKKAAKKTTKSTAKKATKKVAAKKSTKKVAAKKTPKTKSTTMSLFPPAPAPTVEEISHAAYLNYLNRQQAGIEGSETDDWLAAEESLKENNS